MKITLSDVEVHELISLFVALGLAQDRALLESETNTFNRL